MQQQLLTSFSVLISVSTMLQRSRGLIKKLNKILFLTLKQQKIHEKRTLYKNHFSGDFYAEKDVLSKNFVQEKQHTKKKNT
jgi:hypothetical protein